MPWNYPGGYPSPDDFFSLLQQAKFQLPGRNYSPLPPPMNMRPGGIPPSAGGAAPGAGGPTPPPVTPGAPLGHPPGGYTGGYGPGLGDIGAQIGAMGNWPSAQGSAALGGGPGMSGATGSWNPGQHGATGSWTPATSVPPEMAQAGLPPTSGLLGALWGNPRQPPPLTYGDWTTPNRPQLPGLQFGDWTTPTRAQPDTKPLPADKTITDLRPPSGPTGAKGEGPSPNQPQPVYPPQPKVAAKPKPKAKPRQRVQAGNQARNTSWETHSEAYNPIQGTFGHQAWRTPRR